MFHRRVRRILFAMLIGAIAMDAHAQEVPDHFNPGQARRAGTVLVIEKPDASPQQQAELRRILRKYGLETRRQHGRWKQLQSLQHAAGKEEQIAAEIIATGAAVAEPDYLVREEAVPNDPNFASQWLHTRIDSPGAWDITTGAGGALVAVVDSGISAQHPDLEANVRLPGFNTVDNSSNSAPMTSHGTSVAGVIGAVGNNALGVAGVSWQPQLLPVRITNLPDGYAYCSDMAEGIRYGADQGARVVNLSYNWGACPSTIDAAAADARGKGALVVTAAGNDNADISTRPDSPSFLAVGATDEADAKASFSNWGTPIDLVAPGVNIMTTSSHTAYVAQSGTSLASPVVTGVAALILSLNPALAPAQVEEYLLATATDLGTLGDDSTFGRGLVNAGAALQLAQSRIVNGDAPPTIAQAAAVNANPVTARTARLSALGADNGGEAFLSYTWANAGPAVGAVSFSPNGTNAAKDTVATFAASGTYPIQVAIRDTGGQEVVSTVQVQVELPDTQAPSTPSGLKTTLVTATEVALAWTASSDDVEVTGYRVFRNGVAVSTSAVNSWTDTGLTGGTLYAYKVSAFDAANNESPASASLSVRTAKQTKPRR
jgi:hypothetical protein